jgi:hypothetical protein
MLFLLCAASVLAQTVTTTALCPPCSVTKAPAEQIDLSLDFTARAPNGITLLGVLAINQSTKADASSTIIMPSPAPAVSGNKVSFRVQGGANAQHFSLLVRVSKNDTGEVLEGEITLYVIQQ